MCLFDDIQVKFLCSFHGPQGGLFSELSQSFNLPPGSAADHELKSLKAAQTVAPGLETDTWGNHRCSLSTYDQKMVIVLLLEYPASVA